MLIWLAIASCTKNENALRLLCLQALQPNPEGDLPLAALTSAPRPLANLTPASNQLKGQERVTVLKLGPNPMACYLALLSSRPTDAL